MRHLRTLAVTAAAALALTGCGGGSSSKTSTGASATGSVPANATGTLATIKQSGKIRVGTKFDQPGFGLKALSGKPEGFDVEVATMIAGDLGIAADKIEWVEAPSKVREELIEQGKVDMVVATYTINDKRKERISFAGPYYKAGQQIMVKKDNSALTGPDALKANPTQKVCSVTGSTPAEKIKEYLGSPDQLVLFDVYDKCVEAMKNDQVQAVTTDNVILLGYVSKSNGAYKLVGDQFTAEPYGIGIKKGDKEFCTAINAALTKNKDAYAKAWQQTAGKFEGAKAAELPTFDICA